MIYDTKTALILRRDLAAWQVANVAAFLAGGLTGTHGHMMGEPYRDGSGRAGSGIARGFGSGARRTMIAKRINRFSLGARRAGRLRRSPRPSRRPRG